MGYRIAGRCTDLCSCHTPCPCAFGQTPTGGTCAGMFCFDIQEGQYENVNLAGTRAIFADVFSGGPWMDGNFTAALILDANSSQEQRDALTDIFTGEAGGDGAEMMALVGDMKGVFVAPIEYEMTANGEITVRAGELAEAGGGVLRGLDGTSEITVTNARYPLPTVIAGKSTPFSGERPRPGVRQPRLRHVDRPLRAQGLTSVAPAAGEAAPRRAVPLVVPAAVATAWGAALVAAISGRAGFLDHDALFEVGALTWAGLVLFLVAWQAMVAAMMLPSSLPMVRHFGQVAIRQGRPPSAVLAFVAGYFMVWTLFGAVAIAGDGVVHRLVDAVDWVERHPWVVTGTVLLVAGAFQFSALKDKCLTECRAPAAFLVHQFLRGVHGSFPLGVTHGWYCLGCCWPLMLIMFAAGVANLLWMAALTAVMVYEKVGRAGRRLAPVSGIVLLVWGVLVLAHPAWLSGGLAGV